MSISILFLLIALVLALCAGFGVGANSRANLGWLSLASFFISLLIDSGFLSR